MILPDFRIKEGGKVAIADIEKKTAYAERIQNGIRLMKQLEDKRDDPPKLNRDLTEANKKIALNADVFAQNVKETLTLIEEKEGKKFKSLGERVRALNHHEDGIPTRRGKVWTKTGMRNLLKRLKRPNDVKAYFKGVVD